MSQSDKKRIFSEMAKKAFHDIPHINSHSEKTKRYSIDNSENEPPKNSLVILYVHNLNLRFSTLSFVYWFGKTSPSQNELKKKKRRELKREIVLLTERNQALETNQIELNNALQETVKDKEALNNTLQEIKKEKEALNNENSSLKAENLLLLEEIKQLKMKLDRFSERKMKDFVNRM